MKNSIIFILLNWLPFPPKFNDYQDEKLLIDLHPSDVIEYLIVYTSIGNDRLSSFLIQDEFVKTIKG